MCITFDPFVYNGLTNIEALIIFDSCIVALSLIIVKPRSFIHIFV